MSANPVTEYDREFAAVLDSYGAKALKNGSVIDAGWYFDAADFWAEPAEATVTARMLLLNAALGRQESTT